MTAPNGIGGQATVVGVAEAPAGIAGCSGIVSWKVVQEDIPPLLPVGLTRALKMRLDLDDSGDMATFRAFGGSTRLRTLPSGHTAISVVEFPCTGWAPPAQDVPTLRSMYKGSSSGGGGGRGEQLSSSWQPSPSFESSQPADSISLPQLCPATQSNSNTGL